MLTHLHNKYKEHITDNFKNTILLHFLKRYNYTNILNIIKYTENYNINSFAIDELLKNIYVYGSIYNLNDSNLQIILLKYC